VKKNDPSASLILETLAICYVRDFRYRYAAYALTMLLEREPDNLRALDWRSWVSENLGHKERVFDDCRRALQLCPEMWKVRLRLVNTLLADRNPVAATEHLRILEEAHADVGEVRLARARWQLLQGQTEPARQTLDAFLANEPESAAALFLRGRLEADPVKAEKYFRSALDGDQFSNETWYNLYLALSRQGKGRAAEAKQVKARYEKNEKDFQQLKAGFEELEKSPSAGALARIGETYLKMGMPADARKFFVRVLELEPANKRAHEVLESLEERRGSAGKQTK
jgi:tetratricopeptide (TPR) repeat protein